MFGTLGGPEIFLILVIALIVFGPRKLPEIGKGIGRTLAEFRRASNDFKRTIEDEVEAENRKSSAAGLPAAVEPGPAPVEPAADAEPAAEAEAHADATAAEPDPTSVSRESVRIDDSAVSREPHPPPIEPK